MRAFVSQWAREIDRFVLRHCFLGGLQWLNFKMLYTVLTQNPKQNKSIYIPWVEFVCTLIHFNSSSIDAVQVKITKTWKQSNHNSVHSQDTCADTHACTTTTHKRTCTLACAHPHTYSAHTGSPVVWSEDD